jgi:polyphosphate kinase
MPKPLRLIDRHLSWLAFNHRVLQEAADLGHPLLERLRFLAIFSSNLDEFFRVRVPAIHALHDAGLMEALRTEVDRQQKEFGRHYLEEILPALRAHGIRFVYETELDAEQIAAAREYWGRALRQHIQPFFVEAGGPTPFLYNRQLYLVVVLKTAGSSDRYAIVDVPTQHEARFVELPGRGGERYFIFLDDIVRLCLPELLPGLQVAGAYSVKLTRDAELHIEDEFSGDLLEKIREGLSRRKTGTPSRFLYDPEIPQACLDLLRDRLSLHPEGLIPGWRYHNFNDFFDFPNPGIEGVEYEPLTPLRHHDLDTSPSLFDAIDARDRILHYPYQSYDYVIRFLNEAAKDPAVTSIDMTLYRVASKSEVVRALIGAARSGKKVTAFIEMKARFDEEANFFWADELQHAGARVVYSLPGFKVHCKLCLVVRSIGGAEKLYAYLSTGNFNEKTARVYTDHGLFTADTRITRELGQVFEFLEAGQFPTKGFQHLLVAPFNMRQRFTALLDEEIRNAQSGKRAYVILKLNNLEDAPMIQKLREAARAGVEIRLIVRSICCLPPTRKSGSRPIEVVSIVDRFLEHGRIYIFHNGGDEQYFIGSADWMTRNLSRRVEVVFPIFDETVRSEIRAIIDTQLRDNVKARILDVELSNRFKQSDDPPIRSQMETYCLIKGKDQNS